MLCMFLGKCGGFCFVSRQRCWYSRHGLDLVAQTAQPLFDLVLNQRIRCFVQFLMFDLPPEVQL